MSATVLCHSTSFTMFFTTYRGGCSGGPVTSGATTCAVYDLTPATSFAVNQQYTLNSLGSSQVVELGAECVGASFVAMPVADYNSLRTHLPAMTTTDISLLVSAVALVWGIAWLWRRVLRQFGRV